MKDRYDATRRDSDALFAELGRRAHHLAVLESLNWPTPLWWIDDTALLEAVR